MSEIQQSNLGQIEAEIVILKHQTAQNIIEIGKRLIQAKEMLPHGKWGKWLEEKVEFSDRTARRFMHAANEFSNWTSLSDLPPTKIFALLDVPKEEREEFIRENKVDEMTTRELQQVIKEKKELEHQLEQLKNRPPEVIEKEVIKEVQVGGFQQKYFDEQYKNSILEGKIQHLNRDLSDKEFALESLKSEVGILEKKAKLNDDDAKKYKELKDQIEKLSQQKSDLGRQIKSRTELSGLVVRIEHILKTELAPVKYSRAISEASTDEIVVRNLMDIVGRVQDWCDEMCQYIPWNSDATHHKSADVIEMEAIEHE